MENKLKFALIAATAVLLVFGGIAGGCAIATSANEKKLTSLRNEIAEKDKTIEVKDGLYQKLAVDSKNLKDLLDKSNEQVRSLQTEVKKKGEDLITANTVALNWKRAYEAAANAHQVDVPPVTPAAPGEPPAIVRKKVEFDKDFGYLVVHGYTLTDPAEAWVSVKQGRPLRVTVAVARAKDDRWVAYATSSEENISVDIELASVDTSLLDQKWYERISFELMAGGGTGALVGLGASLEFGKFRVGPAVWGTWTPNGGLAGFIGATLSWSPFKR